MNDTAFPATPADVAILTVQEFTFNIDRLDPKRVPSLDHVCRAFIDDGNRALVWWIRFDALQRWWTTIEGQADSISDALADACEVAASFPLDPHWAFDDKGFAWAVANCRRTRAAASNCSI